MQPWPLLDAVSSFAKRPVPSPPIRYHFSSSHSHPSTQSTTTPPSASPAPNRLQDSRSEEPLFPPVLSNFLFVSNLSRSHGPVSPPKGPPPPRSSCAAAVFLALPIPNIRQPPNMSGLDAPEIAAAYDAVRSDKDETSWLLISYASAVGNKMTLTKTGTGGLSELASELDDSQVQYAYVRVEYANDVESKRVKFAFVIWIGQNTKIMRKARVSIESSEVKRVLPHHSITVNADHKGDLDEDDIVKRLRKAGGADYNGGRG
ncbi:cofilin/tropomyosin-type actin-binding protein [Colletotrichum fioriniae PJ7]|uniref:Cofilin/tropomyosin-type actin-binding protein n=12 Tax=Colletotrichum acutatum species complex TaxID=2707335 RepID=A0A010QNT1_9PEZI|nr:cofilin/tropomyosin-type actin-binding protein [Colletotrichum fioriniae PJ7]